MSNEKNHGFSTRAVHAGYHPESGPVNPPIEESSTCVFNTCDDGANRFASREKDGIYARLSNPTVRALEQKMASLENGYDGIATGSGMAAVDTVYFHYLKAGGHLVATASMYGPSRSIAEKNEFYVKWGAKATFLDTSDLVKLREAITSDTMLLYIETPANPTLSMTDIAGAAEIAHQNNIPLVVDNTFCSPFLQNPLDLGADVVLHSMTKSIGGHANAVGGMIVAKTEETYYALRNILVNKGGILSPHDANLFNTGVKTLALRMERMQENMAELADFLSQHSKISWIKYPGLETHPQHELVKKQMRGPGSMASFGVKGGFEEARTLLDNLHLITLAVSLGGVESLIQHPASMTHAGVPQAEREKAGISEDLVRLSAGIENLDDLIKDLKQAFDKIG